MKFKIGSRKVIFSVILFLLLAAQNVSSASITWDVHQDIFSYKLTQETITYDPFWDSKETETINDSIIFSEVGQSNNVLSFRVKDNETIFNYIHCETFECKNATLYVYGYDNITGTIEMDLICDEGDNILGFQNKGMFGFLGDNYSYPIHIVDLVKSFDVWNTLFGCFLPFLVDDFDILTNPDLIDIIFEEYSSSEKAKFFFNDIKLEGESFDVHYKHQDIGLALVQNISKEILLQYLPNGVLCYLEISSEAIDIFQDEIILITDIHYTLSLQSGYETFTAVSSMPITIVAIVALCILLNKNFVKKKMKERRI